MLESKPMVAVITGAANGIGRATWELIKGSGASTIVCDREQCDEENYIFLDLSEPESISECVRSLPENIDALINCAGIAPSNGNNSSVLQVNWLGTKTFTEAALMKIKPGGSVTTVASRAGAKWEENIAQLRQLAEISEDELDKILDIDNLTPARAYELSKELLIFWSMMNATTRESIRFNTVSPSSVETRLTPSFKETFKSRKINNSDLRKRTTTPDEIASAIWFLANPSSASINGIDLKVDQGITAQRLLTELTQ
jgi:NAD(P)-dependent dehydrogenase (short-subunit alcohol dehydrogenase family)